jgi:hypothetical protein
VTEFGKYGFAPWAREGAAAAVTTPDVPGQAHPGRAELDVTLTVNGIAVPAPLRLNGPGDVVGLDSRQIVRTEPRPWTQGFEPNYFPAVEFDRPDLPWLFTPLAANTDSRLRPWLCLVVVRKQDGVRLLPPSSTTTLPVLRIGAPATPAAELPDLAESWAWAHVQTIGEMGGKALATLQQDHPERTLSRLVCPRRLAPTSSYYACVVPTFDAGVQAGLGKEVPDGLAPAWTLDEDLDEIELPVYHHWEFGTGAAGDFESLVRLLKARPVPASVGYRDMYVGDAGFGLPKLGPDAPEAVLAMEGALRAPKNGPKPWLGGKVGAYEEALRTRLDAPETQLAASGGDPIVAPPLYGRWHAAQKVVPVAVPSWVRDLNLDPRHRAAAALGTKVVQGQQEALMQSAWEQVGDVLRANRALREAQLARAAGVVFLAKHLAPMSVDQLVASTAPAHGRLLMSPVTLHEQVAASALPDAAVSAVFRRIVRPASPVRRRFRGLQAQQPLLERLNLGDVVAVPQWTLPAGAVTASWATETFWGGNAPSGPLPKAGLPTAEMVREAVPPKDFTLPLPEPKPGTGEPRPSRGPEVTANFLTAAARHLEATEELRNQPGPPALPPLSLAQVGATLLERLDPRVTIPARVGSRVEVSGTGLAFDDPIEPIMAYPEFPQPMYEPLRDLSPDLLVPGIEQVAADTVTLLETNSRFIEAYLVGLNHEMGRELLWREYPTDQRGSCFRQFWDTRGRVQKPADPEDLLDIEEIHAWKKNVPIGGNLAGPTGESDLVLLIRGELLRRYPTTIIYAVPVVEQNGVKSLGTDERHPVFRGTLPPDVTFLGFDMTAEEALHGGNGHGWFFVLQEPATEPRFGLDVAGAEFGGTAASWSDLSWSHLAGSADDFEKLTHAPAGGSWPKPAGNAGSRQWGKDSAHLAAITMQQPMRVAVTAAAMITQGT